MVPRALRGLRSGLGMKEYVKSSSATFNSALFLALRQDIGQANKLMYTGERSMECLQKRIGRGDLYALSSVETAEESHESGQFNDGRLGRNGTCKGGRKRLLLLEKGALLARAEQVVEREDTRTQAMQR